MQWKNLITVTQLDEIVEESRHYPVLIFKHSTRCSISIMIKNRLDKHEAPVNTVFYYLDLLAHRTVSNQIADRFNIAHESPQVLVIRNGECIYEESHNGILFDEITEHLS